MLETKCTQLGRKCWNTTCVAALALSLCCKLTIIIFHYFFLSCRIYYRKSDESSDLLISGPNLKLNCFSIVSVQGCKHLWITGRHDAKSDRLHCHLAYFVTASCITTLPKIEWQIKLSENRRLLLAPSSSIPPLFQCRNSESKMDYIFLIFLWYFGFGCISRDNVFSGNVCVCKYVICCEVGLRFIRRLSLIFTGL